MPAAVFLDRDGVLNVAASAGEYIQHPQDLLLLPGVGEALRRLGQAGYHLIVVTNQRGVALGRMSEGDLEQVHGELRRQLEAGGARLDLILACPHGMDEGCACRKPRPGMLIEGARLLGLDLSASWMVGDNHSDMQAGRAAGVRCVRVCTDGRGTPQADSTVEHACHDLRQATDYILGRGGP